MALTDRKIRATQPESKPYHLTDGHGLFLAIQTNGSKLWRWKYRFQGKFRLMAFGSYPEVSLADARAAQAEARAKLLNGTDPMAERKARKNAALESKSPAEADANREVLNSLRDFATQWFEKWRAGKVERYLRNTETRLKEDVLSRAHWRVDSSTVGRVRSQREAMEHTGWADEDETPSSGSAVSPSSRRDG